MTKGIPVMYWNGDMGEWGYALMGMSFLLFWGAVITGIALIWRSIGNAGQRGGQYPSSRTAEDLLADRFARGEIDETEYRSRVAVLKGHA
ncbi:SHOCT domain-containing protein [Arthrobacter sp. CAN_A1]|uniref:SHOCT domain-containing protein n=1 Tax=Arthrobacter sp. CAN_A1 TaxID=2787717 RepID=UPI001A254657